VVARHEARGLAEREGLAGVRGVLAGLIGQAVDGGGRVRKDDLGAEGLEGGAASSPGRLEGEAA
jgi:hypothetical protein